MQLSRSAIAKAAVGILDDYGLADVSMRRVAASLGVAPGALYWHVENKQELLSAMADIIVSPVVERTFADPREACSALRSALLAHRDGAEVVSAAAAQPTSRIFEALVTAISGSFPEQSSLIDAAAPGLLYLTLGAAAIHQSGAQLNEATASQLTPRGSKAQVDEAIELLLAGLDAQ